MIIVPFPPYPYLAIMTMLPSAPSSFPAIVEGRSRTTSSPQIFETWLSPGQESFRSFSGIRWLSS